MREQVFWGWGEPGAGPLLPAHADAFLRDLGLPGGIVEIRTDMPADAGLGVPAAGESLVFNRTLAQDVPGAAKP